MSVRLISLRIWQRTDADILLYCLFCLHIFAFAVCVFSDAFRAFRKNFYFLSAFLTAAFARLCCTLRAYLLFFCLPILRDVRFSRDLSAVLMFRPPRSAMAFPRRSCARISEYLFLFLPALSACFLLLFPPLPSIFRRMPLAE